MIPETIRRAIPIRQHNGANGLDTAELAWRRRDLLSSIANQAGNRVILDC